MAKRKCFVVFDSKVEAYMHPHFARSTGEAERMFSVVANDPKTEIGAHPEDFTLFETAVFDEETGRFEQYQTLRALKVALQLKKPPVEESVPSLRSV